MEFYVNSLSLKESLRNTLQVDFSRFKHHETVDQHKFLLERNNKLFSGLGQELSLDLVFIMLLVEQLLSNLQAIIADLHG